MMQGQKTRCKKRQGMRALVLDTGLPDCKQVWWQL
ncbi:hypothetical protein CCP4SC76_3470003 [Gammaproteobacteria bacterium]